MNIVHVHFSRKKTQISVLGKKERSVNTYGTCEGMTSFPGVVIVIFDFVTTTTSEPIAHVV